MLEVSLRRDTSPVCITVAPDRSHAILSIGADAPMHEVDPSVLTARASEQGVMVDADVERRLRELAELYRENNEPLEEIFARAVDPAHGVDGHVRWEEGFEPHSPAEATAEVEPTSDGDGPDDTDGVDHYARGVFRRVSAGTLLGVLVEETPGTDGRDVTGNVLAAKPGKACSLTPGPGVLLEDGGRLVAEQDGVIHHEHKSVSVLELLDVPGSVDFSTGNIHFDGSLVVREGIKDRFSVKVSGDVHVDGLIEAATIYCGGDMHCRAGMAGRDKGRILVKGSLEIGFLNQVRGVVHGELIARREVMYCDLFVGGGLQCRRGAVIGGQVTVTGACELGELGASSGTPTVLVVGAVPLLSEQLSAARNRSEELESKIIELRARLQSLKSDTNKANPADKERSEELNATIDSLVQEQSACNQTVEDLAGEIRRIQEVKVSIQRKIHPKSVIRINDREVVFDKEVKGPLTICWRNNRQLMYRMGSGPLRPLSQLAREVYRSAA